MLSIGIDESEGLNEIYKEMVNLVGYENTMILYTYFKGQQITFPVRLFKPDYIKEVFKKYYNGKNVKELSRTYGYSERWIKEMIKKG